MSKHFQTRMYSPGDEEKIVQLLQLVFNGWPHFDLNCTPLDHWKWKHLDNPLKMPIISLAFNNDKIIGCTHTIPQKVKIGEDIQLCGVGVDSAVHPAYRKRGIYNHALNNKFILENKMNIKIYFSLVANPILIKRNLNHGYSLFPHNIIIFFRINDFNSHFKMMPTKYAWIKKSIYKATKLFNRVRAFSEAKLSYNSLRIMEIQSFDNSINLFWKNIKNQYKFIIEKIMDYLNWRYCDSRGGDYLIKVAIEDKHILGYIVLRINKYLKEYPKGYIVDLLTLPNRLDAAIALVEDAVHYFDDKGINMIQCWTIQNHPYTKILYRYGFVDSKTNFRFFYYPHSKEVELEKLWSAPAKKINYSYGDVDAI